MEKLIGLVDHLWNGLVCVPCRQCCVGTELVDWLVLQSACVLTRSHAVGMWQALLEEGGLNHGELRLSRRRSLFRLASHLPRDTGVCLPCALQWTRNWVSRTSTCSTASWTTRTRTRRCPARRRRGRVRRSCRRPSSSSLRLAQTHCCA